MKSYWMGAVIGALAGIGLAATAQAAPAGMPGAATVVDQKAGVTQVHSRHRHYRRHGHRHYHRHHRHRYGYYYGSPYYGWAPRRHYRPYYGYYGHRRHYRPGFSIWF